MSGFFGVVRRNGTPLPTGLLEKIAGHLRPRGPDSANILNRGEMSGCFTLMRVDGNRQASRQPVTLDERYWLLGDVRLDGRAELIQQLARSDDPPGIAATDEELLLHAWRVWGHTCLPRLLGDFLFALWDAHEKQLWCARHFVGARPFFYANSDEGFCFSNTLRALLDVPELSRDLDDVFVGDFLLEGWCSDPSRSVYRDIRRLSPGHLLRFVEDRVEITRFLTLPMEDPLGFSSPQECLEGYRDLLDLAVKDRLPEGPAALYLSGGLDSGAVCAVAAKLAQSLASKSSLKAFTVSWSPLLRDKEPAYARLTAQHLGLRHQVLDGPSQVPWAESSPSEDVATELSFDPFFSMTQKHFRDISSHARVILSGDGGDDVLTGQAWPYLVTLCRQRDWTTIANAFGGFLLSHGRLPPLRGGFRSKVRQLLGKEDHWSGYPEWLNHDLERRAGLRQRWQDLGAVPESQHPLHPQAYASLHSSHWAVVLEGEDAAVTGALLETRAPLLDLRLLKFLLRLPPVPWCVDKLLTREAMKSHLPPKILQRPKTPLAGNPLEVYLHQQNWRPSLPSQPSGPIHQFVNWSRWLATLENVKGSLSSVNLRPFALFLWLKAIEND